jgi:5-methylcytosine-specific restriction endonuclease McrA
MKDRFCAGCRGMVAWTVETRTFGTRQVKYKACRWCKRPTQASRPKPARPIRKRVTLAAKRVAAKRAGWVDPDSWQAVIEFYDGLCGYCELRPWKQRDHWVPIARGGLNVVSNLIPACIECNGEKGTSQTWEPKRRHPFMLPTDVSVAPDSIPQEERKL